jgi:3,4-dihydroxy 2-butanone 4-phosphate synthase/GTP cyclohydrolase II
MGLSGSSIQPTICHVGPARLDPATGSGRRDALVEAAVAWLRESGPVVMLHIAADREMGCVVASGSTVDADALTLMLVHCCGMPFIALSPERCEELELWPQRSVYDAAGEDRMVSIDARDGVTTGVSAADRARTMRVSSGPDSGPESIVVPGHVHPVRASPDEMLKRITLRDVALYLASLAGSPHGAVCCHIMESDGSLGTLETATAVADRFGLPIVTTADVHDRFLTERPLVVRRERRRLMTGYGEVSAVLFEDRFTGGTHLAVAVGDLSGPEPLPVSVRTQSAPEDLLGHLGSHDPIEDKMREFAGAGRGVLLYLSPLTSNDEPQPEVRSTRPSARDLGAIREQHLATQILLEFELSLQVEARPE